MNERKNLAISEIIGTILLLLIAVSSFSVIYLSVMSNQEVSESTIVNIVGTVKGKNIILEHRGGEEIDINAKLTYVLNGTTHSCFVQDFLEKTAKENSEWNLGERCYIPFNYDVNYLQQYDEVKVEIVDTISNSLVFTGTINLYPASDLGLNVTVFPKEPSIGDEVTIIIDLSNLGGDVGARNVKIRCLLPRGLIHNWNTTTKGKYDNSSGIWQIDKINVNDTETLEVNAHIAVIEKRFFTQLAVILDGSGSISSTDWDIMREGLGNAVANESIFPRDKSVELTVVQFGEHNPSYAQTEINQKIISNKSSDAGYYDIVSSNIKSISQMGLATPTACGIRLATDKIHDSGYFNQENRSIIILVTDGKANCEWIPGGYTGVWDGNGWVQSTTRSHSGSASAHANVNADGAFISQAIDTTNASMFHIDFWYRLDDTDYVDDLEIYYYDGTNYNSITSLAYDSQDTWLHYQDTVSDPQYLHSNFRIKIYSRLEWGENIWIDDVTIDTGETFFTDSFEGSDWNKYWSDPGKLSAEEARQYMISTLKMNESQDAFNSLAVGSGADLYWLKNTMVWPQPGYEAPPFNNGSGWVNYISSYKDFEMAINNIFKTIFEGRVTPVKIEQLEPFDPNDINNDIQITIVPKDQ
ncbi:MAG: VWA domain-containing protein [Candidatus Thermoplasmatota archaeon]|nr:VWA domain-containing protein [Candidatus Thermoplasmatota archaeon]